MAPKKPDFLGLVPVSSERDALIAEAQASERRAQRRQDAEHGLDYLRVAGLSARHVEHLSGEPVRESPAVVAVRGRPRDGIWCLSGNAGCGKTLAAHLWLLADGERVMALEDCAGLSVGMVTAAFFARTSRYERNLGAGVDKFEFYSRPARLVIDDLGVEYVDVKGSFLADLDELLDLRWRDKRATLITTNLDKDTFKARYGQRVSDRIRHEGGWLNVAHDTMRTKR